MCILHIYWTEQVFTWPNSTRTDHWEVEPTPPDNTTRTTSWDFKTMDVKVLEMQRTTASPETTILQLGGNSGIVPWMQVKPSTVAL